MNDDTTKPADDIVADDVTDDTDDTDADATEEEGEDEVQLEDYVALLYQ